MGDCHLFEDLPLPFFPFFESREGHPFRYRFLDAADVTAAAVAGESVLAPFFPVELERWSCALPSRYAEQR